MKLVEHGTQSLVSEFMMLAVRHSIAEEFPTAHLQVHLYNKCDKYWKIGISSARLEKGL